MRVSNPRQADPSQEPSVPYPIPGMLCGLRVAPGSRLSWVTSVEITLGDITNADVDAIVNAASEMMLGGGGVDGAIHRAAGPGLLAACRDVAEVRPGVRCPTGEARVTLGFRLPASYVIHTVGPRYAMPDAQGLLAAAFTSSLEIASSLEDVQSVAIPAISCGVYGYPFDEAADIAASTVAGSEWNLDLVRFVLFSEESQRIFSSAFRSVT